MSMREIIAEASYKARSQNTVDRIQNKVDCRAAPPNDVAGKARNDPPSPRLRRAGTIILHFICAADIICVFKSRRTWKYEIYEDARVG